MSKTVVILHGWGLSGQKYISLSKLLTKGGFNVFSPDMPGFGSEPLVTSAMKLEDYVTFVVQFFKKNKIKKAYIVGHSFGGRVGAKLAVTHPELIEKIIFTGSPLIREKLSFKKNTLQFVAKKGKVVLRHGPDIFQKIAKRVVYRMLGEYDYYKADKLRETFKNIIEEDLKKYLPKISVPVLLLWGEHDTLVNTKIAQEIAEMIPNSQLQIIPGEGHSLPYKNPKIFSERVLSFISL